MGVRLRSRETPQHRSECLDGSPSNVLGPCPCTASLRRGYGHTFALKGSRGTRNLAFFVEFEGPEGPLGVRFEGNETISLLFLTANVTYALGSRDAQLQPYLVGGLGTPFALAGGGGLTLNAGGGLRFRYPNSKMALFAEARVFRLLMSDEFRHTIAPVTVGVRVGF